MNYQLFKIDGAELRPIKKSDKLHKAWFISNLDDICIRISSHIEDMKQADLEEITLYLAERETGVSHFYCRELGFVGEKSEGGCGRECKHYAPRNGKSGACKHIGYTYDNTGRMFLLKLK